MRKRFLGVDGLLKMNLIADDFADFLGLIIEPVVFASGDIAIDSLNERRVNLLSCVENSLAVLDYFLTACLWYPVLRFKLTCLGLEALPHFAWNIGGKEAEERNFYLHHRNLG